MALTGEGDGTLYEMRAVAQNVAEIWRATFPAKKKQSHKVKLKETLIVSRPQAFFTSLKVNPSPTPPSERWQLLGLTGSILPSCFLHGSEHGNLSGWQIGGASYWEAKTLN